MASVDDGNATFAGGQNDGTVPANIAQSQYRKGINVTTKDGLLSPRPGFVEKPITVITEGNINGLSYQKILHSGKFQAAASYDADDGTYIITVISGVIFRINPRTLEAEVINIGDDNTDRMSQYRRRIPWSRAGRFFVLFDYPNLPVIIENREARRVNLERESSPGVPLPEIPTSVLGAFVQGRLWVTNEMHEFTAGDPVGGINADAPITFEETLALAGAFYGQVFSLGTQSTNQPITHLGFLQVADTSTGVGPLILATKNSVYAFRADLQRFDWESSAFGRLLLYNAGIAGPRAADNVNSDLIFLSGDNQVRSLLMGRSTQERWDNASLSKEIEPWLREFANQNLLDIGFVCASYNRVFVSVAPYKTHALSLDQQKISDYAHAGMVVLELDNVSFLGQNANPAWAGLWTGISPMEAITLEDGVYFFAKDDGGINTLYYLDESITYDIYDDKEVDIVSRIYTREYDFQSRFQDKELGHIDYTLTDIEGDFKLHAEYKPGHMENWATWKRFNYSAQVEFCNERNDECLPLLSPHSFREMDFGDPEEELCDPLTNEQSDTLKTVGLRLTLQGRKWKLRDIHLRFDLLPDTNRPSTQKCEAFKSKNVYRECEPSDWEIHRTSIGDALWPLPTLTPW